MRKYAWAVSFGLALTAFTAYISLDTFVLSSAYQTDTSQTNTSMFETLKESTAESKADTDTSEAEKPQKSGRQHKHGSETADNDTPSESTEKQTVIPETTVQDSDNYDNDYDYDYKDENIGIKMTEYYWNNTKIYAADVRLTSAEYLKTAFANDTYGKNVTAKTSETAEANNAVLAVNGDFYGARESGYVIRNGIVYRDTPSADDLLCIYADGTMKVVNQYDYSADELVDRGVWQAFAFGPGLVRDGIITVSESDEVGRAMASNPRTAIGQISENHYLFVVSDGRTSESEGLSLYELAEFMKSLGAETAYNLDGGGSSTMYFNGVVINNPTSNGRIKERGVSDIVYIG
ncbi:MAG: phosphodiester glycosidase family protein [Ruminococcus sp.]|nr:phosphodiester glycosidase family protein [Ruminococcus sp.]